MKTKKHCSGAVLAATFLATFTASFAHAQSVALMDYFYPVQQGATWTYKWTEGRDKATEQLTLVDSDWSLTLYTGRNSPKSYRRDVLRFQFDRDYDSGDKDQWHEYFGNGTSFSRYGDDDDETQARLDGGLVFPKTVSVGKIYSPQADLYFDGKFEGKVTYSLQVIDLLPVTVEAGRFADCVHLQFQVRQVRGVLQTHEMWWAKGIGIIKQKNVSDDGKTNFRELVSRTLKTGPEISVVSVLKSSPLTDSRRNRLFRRFCARREFLR